jgi:hypothetical protein
MLSFEVIINGLIKIYFNDSELNKRNKFCKGGQTMASQNLVSAALAEETQAEILQSLAEIKKKLNFMTTLQPEEIRTLVKAGNGFAPLIEKAFLVACDHPEILPQVFDITEFKKDYALIKALTGIFNFVKELEDGLGNTLIAAKSDAMVGTLEIYTAVRQHRDKVPGLNVIADEMAEFFPRTGKKGPPPVD